MKKSLLLKITLFVIPTMICIMYLIGCSKITEYREAKKMEEKQKQEKKSKEMQKMLNELSNRKEAVLLSIKYKLDEDKIFNLLVETQGLNLEIQDIQDIVKGKSINYRSRLIILSEKYSIPIDILASILIDYYAMQPCEHSL